MSADGDIKTDTSNSVDCRPENAACVPPLEYGDVKDVTEGDVKIDMPVTTTTVLVDGDGKIVQGPPVSLLEVGTAVSLPAAPAHTLPSTGVDWGVAGIGAISIMVGAALIHLSRRP